MSPEQVKEMQWQLDASNHLLTVLLQESGGVIEVSKETLKNTPIAKNIRIVDAGESFIIEGEFHESEEIG